MAEKISIQIALEGGEKVEQQLTNIGAAGKKMAADLSSAAGGETINKLSTSFEQAGQSAKSFAEATKSIAALGGSTAEALTNAAAAAQKFGATASELAGVETAIRAIGARVRDGSLTFTQLATNIDNAKSAAVQLAPAAASVGVSFTTVAALVGTIGPAIVAALTAAVASTISFAEAINKVNDQAIKLGQPIEKVDKFRAALEQAGVSAESVGRILQSKLASEQGVRGLEGFIRELERMPDSAARSKAAVQQFGQAGAELIRILQSGGKLTGLQVGGLISAEDAKRATELGVAINQLENSIGRLNTLGFAPALTVGINAATNAVEILGQRLQQTPWTTFWNAASLGSPITSLISTIAGAITALNPPIQQVGIATQQTSTMFTQWGTVAQQSAQRAGVEFTSFGTVASQSADKAKASMEAAAAPAQSLSDKVSAFAAQIAGIVWDNISSTGVAAWNALSGAISGAYDWLLKYLGLRPSDTPVAGGAPIGQGGIGSHAGGGLLGGRGTGTSDSNLAWVSRGEHIMPAGAVRQPGVFAFLEALRRSGGNLRSVLDGMGRFALGGVVPRAAFATGGLAGGSHVTIQFPGLPAIGGLRASSDVVDQLQRAAALAQVRSGGRKPSRYS